MQTLKNILCRPIKDTPRTRRYQEWLDRSVERYLESFDAERGLVGTRGIALPDETVVDYIDLPLAERMKVTGADAARALAAADGRATTHGTAALAFCWRSPWSKYHHDPHILACIKATIEAFRRRQRRDGVWVFGPGEWTGFGLGWTVEGLIYAYVWIHDELDEAFRARVMEMFRRGAEWYSTDAGFHPISNQQSVWCATMALYGRLLDEPRYLEAAARQWTVARHAFARDGQVLEQGGPCSNYSYTNFAYLYLYTIFADNREHDAQLKEACRWFRRWHTESFYPFEGMSARSTHFLPSKPIDLLPCLERFSAEEPIFARFIDEIVARSDTGGGGAIGHGASPVMWAMLDHPGMVEPTAADLAAWQRPFDRMYWQRDIQYLLVRRRYQTAVTFRGRMPLMGLQTWAWGDEPPIIHPTLAVASKATAWGIDTAEFGVGHAHIGAGWKSEEVLYVPGDWSEWGLVYPPAGVDGGVAEDPCTRLCRSTQTHHHPGDVRDVLMHPGDPAQVVTRWGKLWTYYIFTAAATVVLQNGPVGVRRTRWALNPVCVPKAELDEGVVTFAGREGRLHFFAGKPSLTAIERGEDSAEKNASPVPCAEFEFADDELAAFAFSDGGFAFLEYDRDRRTLTFRDAAGTYRADFSRVVEPDGYVTWDGGAHVNRLK